MYTLDTFQYHSIIAQTVESSLSPNETLNVLGGGLLTIDKAKKTIHTYGTSGGFCPPTLEMVREVLENCANTKGYKLDLTITDYIRD